MAKPQRWKTVRVSIETYERIERLRRELTEAYAAGLTDVVTPNDQTDLVSQAALIGRLLDVYESHRRRSNRRRSAR